MDSKRTDHAVQAGESHEEAEAVPAEAVMMAVPVSVGHTVPVREDPPAFVTANCITLSSANPVVMLVPQDPFRRNAIILAVDNDVYLASSLAAAEFAQGSTSSVGAFYLPAGIAIPLNGQGAIWAALTTAATSSRVSVLINRDDA